MTMCRGLEGNDEMFDGQGRLIVVGMSERDTSIIMEDIYRYSLVAPVLQHTVVVGQYYLLLPAKGLFFTYPPYARDYDIILRYPGEWRRLRDDYLRRIR